MILDSGICSIFRMTDVAYPGEMPRRGYALIDQSWYGELAFETSPVRESERRTELKTDARIRIIQNRAIRQNDVVVLARLSSFDDRLPELPVYRITRAYHGRDDSCPMGISDLSLEVIDP